jgi:hypothetical protein
MVVVRKEVKLCWQGHQETVVPYIASMSTVQGRFVIQCDDGEVKTSMILLATLSKKLRDLITKLEEVESFTLVLPGTSVCDVDAVVSLGLHGNISASFSSRTRVHALISRLGLEMDLEEQPHYLEEVEEEVEVTEVGEGDILLLDNDGSEDNSCLELDTVEVFVPSEDTEMECSQIKFCSVCRLSIWS